MTYKQYLAQCQRMQARYIADERKRYTKLMKLWRAYQAQAHKLGLHPLDRDEIEARFDELRGMEARIGETHGDSPSMRALYQMHCDSEQAAAS